MKYALVSKRHTELEISLLIRLSTATCLSLHQK
jgi:hypothetical protein